VYRDDMQNHHDLDCEGIEVGCTYQDIGCPSRVLRGHSAAHAMSCAFHPDTASGIVIRTQRDLIQSFSDQLDQMRTRQDETTRKLEDLAASVGRRGAGNSSTGVMHDPRTMQDLDAGFEEVHQNLTQLEARQSMWTLNQVMPIREEVTELRSNINMIRMHINWLSNRSREEGRMRAADSSASAAATAVRRDSAGETGITLMERRRSSGTDTDQPRL
jgi:ubiquitin conjugation factor E4 B